MKMNEILKELDRDNDFVGEVMKAMLCYELNIKSTELNEEILQKLEDTLEMWRDNDYYVSFVDRDLVDYLECDLS